MNQAAITNHTPVAESNPRAELGPDTHHRIVFDDAASANDGAGPHMRPFTYHHARTDCNTLTERCRRSDDRGGMNRRLASRIDPDIELTRDESVGPIGVGNLDQRRVGRHRVCHLWRGHHNASRRHPRPVPIGTAGEKRNGRAVRRFKRGQAIDSKPFRSTHQAPRKQPHKLGQGHSVRQTEHDALQRSDAPDYFAAGSVRA